MNLSLTASYCSQTFKKDQFPVPYCLVCCLYGSLISAAVIYAGGFS
jgi:hypothetical protein